MTDFFHIKTVAVSVMGGLFLIGVASAATITFEDFEDATVTYTTNVADDLSDIANRDYYGRIAPDTSTPPGDVSYTLPLGNGYFGLQDSDGATVGANPVILNWTGINISSFTNLMWSGFFAEDDAADTNEDWDQTTSVRVDAQIDGGGFNTIFAIESVDAGLGNRAPAVDTNFDGVGDGAAITDAFTQYSAALGNGTTLDLRITIQDLDTGDEDIAIDNILISGDPIPEPSSALLVLLGVAGYFVRRRR